MPMVGLIITNQELGHNQYKIDRFIEEGNKLGITFQRFINDGTLASVKDGKSCINLPKVDFVIYLDKDIYLARLLEKAGYRIFNKADFIKMCDDKMLTFIACSNSNIPMPLTYSGPLVYSSIEKPHLEFLGKIIKELGFPMVVKKVYGSLGIGVYLVNDKEELINLYQEICHGPILFQKYINNFSSKSIRVIVIDNKPIGAFMRYNDKDFRSNFGSTANSRILENPKKYMDFVDLITRNIEIEYAGIDLLENEDGSLLLCEMNSNAFFEEFEKTTKINVAKLYLEMIIRKTKDEQK